VKSTSEIAHLNALAFLYDHQSEFPVWLRSLSHEQLVDIAKLMIALHSTSSGGGIVPIEEVEQREVIRAITICGGDVMKAARALKMGKTTDLHKIEAVGLFDGRPSIDPPGIWTGAGGANSSRSVGFRSLIQDG